MQKLNLPETWLIYPCFILLCFYVPGSACSSPTWSYTYPQGKTHSIGDETNLKPYIHIPKMEDKFASRAYQSIVQLLSKRIPPGLLLKEELTEEKSLIALKFLTPDEYIDSGEETFIKKFERQWREEKNLGIRLESGEAIELSSIISAILSHLRDKTDRETLPAGTGTTTASTALK